MPNQVFGENKAINTSWSPLSATKNVVSFVQLQCSTAWLMRINGGTSITMSAGATFSFAHIDLATIEVSHGTTGTLNMVGYSGRGASEG